jgi:hypothetical protein
MMVVLYNCDIMNSLVIPQTPLVPLAELEVTEDLVLATPHIRRATPEFAHEYGGPLVTAFLEAADEAGQIQEDTLFMCQPTDFYEGGYPKAPRWHFDFPQGIETITDEDFRTGISGCTGLIACMFEVELHSDDTGTVFVQGGDLTLDLSLRDRNREYIPKQSIAKDADAGPTYWWHTQVEDQLQNGSVLYKQRLQPNVVHTYGSNNMHMAPEMRSSTGRRLLMRINTPTGVSGKPAADNFILDPNDQSYPNYVFYPSVNGWYRVRV